MNIVFVSNFYNQHQAYISRKLYEFTNGEYRFISTEEMPEERKDLGYIEEDEFVFYCGENGESIETVQQWIDSADVVIVSSGLDHLLTNRKKNGSLILRYTERPLKNGFQWWKYPLRWIRWHRRNPATANIYVLCSSAYTAVDYAKFGLFRNKTYKWGYFPECIRYEDVDGLIANKDACEILWCGRLLKLKHPDDVLQVAKRLKGAKYSFHISIIGNGEMEDTLAEMVQKYHLEEEVTLLGFKPPVEVRAYMEKAGIYLFTSDRREGWGAVLNEAMNSACAVVSCTSAGASSYLIDNQENGILYDNENVDALYEATKYLLDHPEEQQRLGRSAYETITGKWSAELAAERLVTLIERLLAGEAHPDLYEDGPCSKDWRT